MTDLEITRLCAEAMGWKAWQSKHGYWNVTDPEGRDSVVCEWNKYDAQSGEKLREPTIDDALAECGYYPLTDDAQAMALVKRFKLRPAWNEMATEPRWEVFPSESSEMLLQRVAAILQGGSAGSFNENLNRAICECVAKMQAAK